MATNDHYGSHRSHGSLCDTLLSGCILFGHCRGFWLNIPAQVSWGCVERLQPHRRWMTTAIQTLSDYSHADVEWLQPCRRWVTTAMQTLSDYSHADVEWLQPCRRWACLGRWWMPWQLYVFKALTRCSFLFFCTVVEKVFLCACSCMWGEVAGWGGGGGGGVHVCENDTLSRSFMWL